MDALEPIKQKIYEIRGRRVMLDRDLAAIYGVETRALNQAVRRNASRFEGDDFMFRLTKDETQMVALRSQNATSNLIDNHGNCDEESRSRSQIVILNRGRGSNIKYLPYAFTELGVAMLSSVLKSETAIRVNRDIMRAFVAFRHLASTLPQPAMNADVVQLRRYRNRRLGEFLKELDLTEGRATGIPTIQDELKANGSPKATIETDEERTFFLIDIPCHPEFVKDRVIFNKDFTKDFIKDFIKGNRTQVSERQEKILFMLADNETLTSQKIAQKTLMIPR